MNLANNECVILLHGLARTVRSMKKMEKALSTVGYQVINVSYPSRTENIETLSTEYIPKMIEQCNRYRPNRIHFVTHSMGGILIRHYLSRHTIANLGRIVMLSPPNQGSEVVDKLKAVPGYNFVNGPAGQQLGTDHNSIPLSLPAVDYPVGIITGNKTINFVLSTLISGENDGKVSTASAKLDGMADLRIVAHTHPLIMRSQKVIDFTQYFLQSGKFGPQ